MKYGLIAVDLDGTLFDRHGAISDANRAAIVRAQQAGALVVLATGRGLVEVQYAVEQLGHTAPVVLAGGAMIADPTCGVTLHRAVMEPHVAMEVIDYLSEIDDDAVLVLLDPEPTQYDYMVYKRHQLTDNSRWWFDHINAKVRYVDDLTLDDLHHVLRVGLVGPADHMSRVSDAMRKRFGDSLYVQHFMAVDVKDRPIHVLEVFVQGVNKWTALQWLADQHEIPHEQVACIGDEINDLPMVQHAGCGIAMANAIEAVRDAADHITTSNAEDGVAIALERMIRGEW